MISRDIIQTNWIEDGRKVQYAARMPLSTHNKNFDFLAGNDTVFGQFAFFRQIDESTYEAVRDPLGIDKLFYVESGGGELHFSPRFTRLFRLNSQIYSVPAGKHVRIGRGGFRELVTNINPKVRLNDRLTLTSLNDDPRSDEGRQFRRFQNSIRKRLERVFCNLRELEDEGFKVFIALSGGLDSSIIANQSVHYLSRPIACTIDLGQSEDAEKSSLIAGRLGIEHLLFHVDRDEMLNAVQEAPFLCQDYRDFNVHCAALNLLLAKNIRSWVDQRYEDLGNRVIILTGDLMNEYVCDYSEEQVGAQIYYQLPRIGKKDLQSYLVRGIDTSDRELYPFAAYGINCIQPYAVLCDLYMGLTEDVLNAPDAKKRLNSFLAPPEILDLIPDEKLRAQVGSHENMGILSLCHNEGISDRNFRKLLADRAGGSHEQIPIFVGKYDTEVFAFPK